MRRLVAFIRHPITESVFSMVLLVIGAYCLVSFLWGLWAVFWLVIALALAGMTHSAFRLAKVVQSEKEDK